MKRKTKMALTWFFCVCMIGAMKRIFFSQNLTAWMRKNDVTAKDLAEALGCDVRTINRHRRGTRFPRQYDLIRYRELMNVSLDRMILEDAAFDNEGAAQ